MRTWKIVADIHIGNHPIQGGDNVSGVNARCRGILRVLERVVQAVAAQPSTGLVIAGDTFDRWATTPQVIEAALSVLAPVIRDTVVIVGNHDMRSSDPRDNAIALFTHAGAVVVDHRPLRLGGVLFVPFHPERVEDYLPRMMAVEGGLVVPRAIVGHFGVSDAETPQWLVGAKDSTSIEWLGSFAEKHGLASIVVGNWHDGKQWSVPYPHDPSRKVTITQAGALVPTGWDNPNFPGYGGVVTLSGDGTTISREELPGPRFLSVPKEHVRAVPLVAPEGSEVYLRVAAAPDELAQVRQSAQDAFTNAKSRLMCVELDPRAEMRSSAARTEAAQVAAKTSASVRERLHQFFSVRYPGEDAGELTEGALEYLRKTQA